MIWYWLVTVVSKVGLVFTNKIGTLNIHVHRRGLAIFIHALGQCQVGRSDKLYINEPWANLIGDGCQTQPVSACIYICTIMIYYCNVDNLVTGWSCTFLPFFPSDKWCHFSIFFSVIYFYENVVLLNKYHLNQQ